MKKVQKFHNKFVSAVLQRKVGAAGQTATDLRQWKGGMEKKAHRGRLWKVFESEQFSARNVGVLHSFKGRNKNNSCGRCSGKVRRKARSVATGASVQRGSGTNKNKCGHRLWSLNDAPCLHRNEAWQLGEF